MTGTKARDAALAAEINALSDKLLDVIVRARFDDQEHLLRYATVEVGALVKTFVTSLVECIQRSTGFRPPFQSIVEMLAQSTPLFLAEAADQYGMEMALVRDTDVGKLVDALIGESKVKPGGNVQ